MNIGAIDPKKIWPGGPPQRFCLALEKQYEKAEIAKLRAELNEPVHGQGGWELAKYEWREDGSARFLYVRNTGERRSVIRQQKAWCV